MWYAAFVLALAGILFWRIVLPGMRSPEHPADASAAAGPATASAKTWARTNALSIALVGVALVVGGIVLSGMSSPDVVGVSAWAKRYWLWLLLLWGVLAALVALNATALGKAAGVLQQVLAGVTIMLFVGLSILGWFTRDRSAEQRQSAAQVCPNVSARETRNCIITSEWSNWIKFANGPEDNGKQMCRTPGAKVERKDVEGTTFWRYKVDEGRLTLAYRLFPGNEPCPASLP